jgi:hypothetical protein
MAMGPASECHFVLRLPSWSLEILEIRTPTILEAHNFFYRLIIEMRFEAKL